MTDPWSSEAGRRSAGGNVSALDGLRICTDSRRRPPGSALGVASYASVLEHTLGRLGARVEHLTDAASTETRPAARLRRWIAALPPGDRPLRRETSHALPRLLRGDLFREAQVHFNVHGRLLKIRSEDPPDIMHWTYPLPLMMVGTRNVYTVHDAIPWTHPELTAISHARHKRLLLRVREAAHHIVTVSEHSRETLIRRLGCPPDFVINTYQATLIEPPPPALPIADLTPDGYLLFCGSVEPRKNVGRLIAAYARSGAALPLVIAGPDGWKASQELRREASPPGGVIRLPWLERSALVALMANARVLLFPSLAEGFGLPVLEAMTLGTPVMTSNRGGPAEIAGDGALTVDPEDTAAMAQAIRTISDDGELRRSLSLAGRRRAAHFSPDAYAFRLEQAYGRVLASGPITADGAQNR